MLTAKERERYDRQIILRGFGEEGQEKLKAARVFIAGCGGLGSAIAIYLTVAGVGNIRIVDHDTVAISNLNRQVLYWEEDIGRVKVDAAREKLVKLNSDVHLECIRETITEDNILELVSDCTAIIDAMDNLTTRFVLNKAAIDKGVPFFHGAVRGLEGRAMTIIPGETACLKCLYQQAPPPETVPVVGVTPAIIGCIQASEVIKYIVGIGKLLAGRLLVYDGLNQKFFEVSVKRDPSCAHCGKLPGRR